MTTYIDNISVKNLGPISQINQKLGKINLVFGHNERGKTLLVEFIIKSLFRNAKRWSLRGIYGEGKITVSGLDKSNIDFYPTSSKKIEDFWELTDKDFPTDFSKLLVVKAADVELSDENTTGIGKEILKQYLSGEGIIDSIQRKIKDTLKNSKIENGEIIGSNMGEIRDLNKVVADIGKVEDKFNQINTVFSQGELFELKSKKNALEEQFKELEKAKLHLAYLYDQQLISNNKKIDKLPDNIIKNLRENLFSLNGKEQGLQQKFGEQKLAKEKSKHYSWLKHSIEIYEKRVKSSSPGLTKLWLVIGLISIVIFSSLLFIFNFNNVFLLILFLIFAIGSLLVYINQQNKFLNNIDAYIDLIDIKKGYKSKFKSDLTGLADLQSLKEQIEPDFYNAKKLKEEIETLESEIRSLENSIINDFYSITKSKIIKDDFQMTFSLLETQKDDLKSELQKFNTDLLVLDVDPSNYLKEAAKVEYDKITYEKTRDEIENISQQINKKENELSYLKQSLCEEINSKITDDWDEIIHKLEVKKGELCESHKLLKAEIIAKILVYQSLESLKAKEEEKIQEGLKSDQLKKALFDVTGKYKSIELINGDLILSDGYVNHEFANLSTGTQEQIFLALRIVFASRISKDDNLFFIFDDAFQYSDWDRRPKLVDKMIELAKNNWQVIYFSMDDNIRDLFIKMASKVLKDQFVLINLDRL